MKIVRIAPAALSHLLRDGASTQMPDGSVVTLSGGLAEDDALDSARLSGDGWLELGFMAPPEEVLDIVMHWRAPEEADAETPDSEAPA